LEGALTSASGRVSPAEITTYLDINQSKMDLKGDINTHA